jgi:type III secretion protein L
MSNEPVIEAFLAQRVVVRAGELSAISEAEEMLRLAHQQAAQIVAQAERQAETMRAQSRSSAAAEAARGYQAGWVKAQTDHSQAMALAQAKQAKTLTGMDERIGVLVTRTLGKVLTEKQVDERFFSSVMQRVLRAARDEKFLTVRVSADQLEAARTAIDSVVKETGAPNFIEVLGDETLRRGACIVESAHGVIDASLETQLDSIRQALSAVWQAGPAHRTGGPLG